MVGFRISNKDYEEFWIKIGFFKKKNYKISFSLKVLPKVVLLGHVGYTTRQLPLSMTVA